MARYTFVVFTRPIDGGEEAFNDWYDNQHIPDVLAVPGFQSARRLHTVDGLTDAPRYLALYELETDDPAAALAELSARAGTALMPMSEALDPESIDAVLYEALSPQS